MTENEQVAIAADSIREWCRRATAPDVTDASGPLTAIVLGSGLGGLTDQIEDAIEIPFGSIPGFAQTTASGHRGQLILGKIDGCSVIAMAGRFHRYEGWSNRQVAFPVRVMRSLGAAYLIASNAAGGVNPKLKVGDIVVIRDHIDWLFERDNGLQSRERELLQQKRTTVGPDWRLGIHSAYRSCVYCPQLASCALSAARQANFHAVEGTYLATLGPTYETRSEYRMMRFLGADVVGMSTVPEVLAAREAGIRVLALSVVSNVANPDQAVVADHLEVLQAGDAASEKLQRIVRRTLAETRTWTENH